MNATLWGLSERTIPSRTFPEYPASSGKMGRSVKFFSVAKGRECTVSSRHKKPAPITTITIDTGITTFLRLELGSHAVANLNLPATEYGKNIPVLSM